MNQEITEVRCMSNLLETSLTEQSKFARDTKQVHRQLADEIGLSQSKIDSFQHAINLIGTTKAEFGLLRDRLHVLEIEQESRQLKLQSTTDQRALKDEATGQLNIIAEAKAK